MFSFCDSCCHTNVLLQNLEEVEGLTYPCAAVAGYRDKQGSIAGYFVAESVTTHGSEAVVYRNRHGVMTCTRAGHGSKCDHVKVCRGIEDSLDDAGVQPVAAEPATADGVDHCDVPALLKTLLGEFQAFRTFLHAYGE